MSKNKNPRFVITDEDRWSLRLYHDISNDAFTCQQRLFALRPLLVRCGLWEPEYLAKYLNEESTEIVYRDALKVDSQRVKIIRDLMLGNDSAVKDFWAPIRKQGCTILDPGDPRFEFDDFMHIFNGKDKIHEKAVNCIVIDDCCNISISDELAREQSYIKVKPERQEVFDMVAELCSRLIDMGVAKNMRMLFTYDREGHLVPNTQCIIFDEPGPIH